MQCKFVAFYLVLVLAVFFLVEAKANELLKWEGCLQEARETNPDLISADEVVKQQKAEKKITASSLYPQINAEFEASKSGGNPTTTEKYSYGVTGSQLIFDGLKTINSVRSANENINAASEGYKTASSEVRFNLRTAFVNLLEAQELVKVFKEIIKIREDNLKLIKLRYSSGLEHKGALMKAEANLAQAEFDLAEAERTIETAQKQLNAAMGRKEFAQVNVAGDFNIRERLKDRPDLEELVRSNPFLLQATAQKRSATFGLKSTYGSFSPQISGTAGANRWNQNWPPATNQLDVGVAVSVPIFEGGLRFAQVSQAKAALKQAAENERSVKDQTIVNLQQTWAGLLDAAENVGVQRTLLAATQERSNIADAQYSTGFTTFDNWIIIEDELVRAKRTYITVKADALRAEAGWIYAKGGTLDYEK